MARFVGRENVRKRLAPLEGEQGRTSYADGAVRIELPGEAIVVRPPFGLAHEHEYATVRLAPLLAALSDEHIVAALLVRLGGYAVGVFDGERLVASKVGSRFVKNRHKKGGSSANRFRRRREEQARALIEEAAEVAVRVLEPWRRRVEFVALGGERGAIDEVLAASPRLGWLAKRALPRFFTVPEPRQRELERLPYELYAAELSIEPKHDRPTPESRIDQRASHITPTKAAAQAKGREMAQRLHTEHKIQNREGRITERNSYGRDPFPPRG